MEKKTHTALNRTAITNTNQKSQMGPHHENAASSTSCRRKTDHRRKRTRDNNIRAVHHQQKKVVHVVSGGDDQNINKEELERKIVALQRIVPGGETLGVDKLFEETADYILALQCKIKAMKVLTNFLEGLEKEKRIFGA